MKTLSWFCWLLVAFVCLSEAKNKIKRPLSLPYSPIVILRRPRPISHRTSTGNTFYIGGNLSHQRIPYKHSMHRIRRPTMYNALSITWKNQLPIRAPLNNGVNLPQRAPVKDFYSINKLAEYSPEYRPEYRPGLVVLPTIHREDIDDDKGPIHTIPAPNLSLAAKPYESLINSEETADRRLMATNYNTTAQNSMTNNFGLATRGDHLSSQGTSHSPSHPTLSRHQYEVTESNDVTLKDHRTLNPGSQSQNLDAAKLYSFLLNNPHQQSDYFLANQPIQSNTDVIQPNVQFAHSNVPPIQTPLHSSLHVGFPSVQTPYTTTQQVPGDLHGHSTLTGPFSAPLSATQLYDLLNTSPHNANQYSSDQQHLLQHQLGQSFQPYLDAAINFPHPQMQSFNYDEQANQLLQQQQQQQQQQNQNVLFDRNYVPESVIPDYNLDSAESSIDVQNDVHEELAYPASEIEFETNIGYDKIHQEETPATYVDGAADKNDISTKFYTVLPNKEAAEKLAILAAAGNINSYLIDRLRKQEQNVQRNNEIPFNHKNDEDNDNDGGSDNNDNVGDNDGDNNNNDNINKQIKDDQQWEYNLQESQQKIQQDHQNQSYKMQNNEPLQIMIPDKDTYVRSNDTLQNTESDMDMEYEYENEEEEIKDSAHDAMLFDEKTFSHANSHKEFGSRLR